MSGTNTSSSNSKQDINELLARISADDYSVWFEVGCALKRLGMPFEAFCAWSEKSEKFDADECAKKWEELPEEPRAGLRTLIKHAAASSFIPVPDNMLPEPQTENECMAQAARYLASSFKPGEEFELCGFKLDPKKANHLIPDRLNDRIGLEDNDTEETLSKDDLIRSWILNESLGGVVVGLNPVNIPENFKGYAPTDEHVLRKDFALLESDEMSIDEQWAKIKQIPLPIQSVVHSAGKSLHIKCHIDAGPNSELYKERVAKLLDYVNRFGFRADTNCRNASRLTRLPGALRDGKRQYAVCWECGYPDWDSFELCELDRFNETNSRASSSVKKEKHQDRRAHTNCNGALCGQEEKKLFDELEAEFGSPVTLGQKGQVTGVNEPFWAEYVMRKHGLLKVNGIIWIYSEKTGLWTQVATEELNNLIAQSARNYGAVLGYEGLASRMNEPTCLHIRGFMKDSKVDPFKSRPKNFIHVANGVVEISKDGTCSLKPFSREYYSRNRCEIEYDPRAQAPRFMSELLLPMLKQNDIDTLMFVCAQCLLGYNLAQKFIVLSGTPGGGKGTVTNVIRGIIGKVNCVELRTEHLGERFETARFIGKSLLIGSDVPPDFLRRKHADTIKKLCGGDEVDAEIKGIPGVIQMEGTFNLIITSNGRLLVNVNDDLKAWGRRMEIVVFDGVPPENPISDFAEILIRDEGSGILNMMVHAAVKLLQNGFPKDSLSSKRVGKLLLESNSIYGFLSTCVERDDSGGDISSEELFLNYEKWCQDNDWEPLWEREAKRKLKFGMENLFHVTQSHDLARNGFSVRGFHGVAFKTDNQ